MGTKFGCYPLVREALTALSGSDTKTPHTMFAAGFLSGACSYFLLTPGYLIKNRLIAQAGRLENGIMTTGACKGKPRQYKHMLDVGSQIVATEGVRQLWRGVLPFVVRGSLLNAGHTGGYDYTKTISKQQGWLSDGPVLHVVASVNAALIMCTLSCPADVVATRYDNPIPTTVSSHKIATKFVSSPLCTVILQAEADTTPIPRYQSAPLLGRHHASVIQCASEIVREGGLMGLYRPRHSFLLSYKWHALGGE